MHRFYLSILIYNSDPRQCQPMSLILLLVRYKLGASPITPECFPTALAPNWLVQIQMCLLLMSMSSFHLSFGCQTYTIASTKGNKNGLARNLAIKTSNTRLHDSFTLDRKFRTRLVPVKIIHPSHLFLDTFTQRATTIIYA